MTKIFAIAAAAAALVATPGSAQSPAPQAAARIVTTSDLNLRTDAGMASLDRRINIAVRQVCGMASDFDVRGKNEVRRCREATRERIAVQRSVAIASAWASADAARATQ